MKIERYRLLLMHLWQNHIKDVFAAIYGEQKIFGKMMGKYWSYTSRYDASSNCKLIHIKIKLWKAKSKLKAINRSTALWRDTRKQK